MWEGCTPMPTYKKNVLTVVQNCSQQSSSYLSLDEWIRLIQFDNNGEVLNFSPK